MEKEYKYRDGYAIEPNNIKDVVIVRKYGEELIKIHQINSYPNPQTMHYNKNQDCYRPTIMIDGFEFWADEVAIFPGGEVRLIKEINRSDKNTVNDIKLLNNLTRAKNKIFELAICNPWEYFVTLTINKDKHNRYDLVKYYDKFTHFIRNHYNRKGYKIDYLFVPEKHKDGAWHLHGFIKGLPKEALSKFNINQCLPNYIRKKLKSGEVIYNWNAYQEKFGFCNVEPIRSHEKASYYVTKYITKDLQRNVSKLGGKLYYPSRGLERAEVVAKGEYNGHLVFDFENDFCKCNTLAYSKELMDYILTKVSDEKGYLKPVEFSEDYIKECAKHGLTPRKGWVNENATK